MATTALSNRAKLYDPVRRRWVASTPEEQVRQALLSLLLESGIPPHHLLVEVALERLPCRSAISCAALRRCDLLCARFCDGVFTPYLLVECKAHSASEKDLDQLLAYQSAIQSRWLALATPQALWVYDTQSAADQGWSNQLPSFSHWVD
jgi:hypothetical protein